MTKVFVCLYSAYIKYSSAYSSVLSRRTAAPESYQESHPKNVFGVSWPTQDGHTDNVLSEVYGAIAVLDRVKETAISILGTVNAQTL